MHPKPGSSGDDDSLKASNVRLWLYCMFMYNYCILRLCWVSNVVDTVVCEYIRQFLYPLYVIYSI